MNNLIHQLTLGAGLNNESKIVDYLEISRSTWQRRLKAGRLRRVEWDALRYCAGFIYPGKNFTFDGWRTGGDYILTRSGASIHANQIEQFQWFREMLGDCQREVERLQQIEQTTRRFANDLFLYKKTGS